MQGVFNWNDAVASYPMSPRGQADFIRDLWHGAFTAVFSLAFELGLPILPALGTDVDVRAEWQDRSCLPRPRRDSRSYSGRTLSQRATKHSEAGAEATGRKPTILISGYRSGVVPRRAASELATTKRPLLSR